MFLPDPPEVHAVAANHHKLNELREGDDVQLNCVANSRQSRASITWLKNVRIFQGKIHQIVSIIFSHENSVASFATNS